MHVRKHGACMHLTYVVCYKEHALVLVQWAWKFLSILILPVKALKTFPNQFGNALFLFSMQ